MINLISESAICDTVFVVGMPEISNGCHPLKISVVGLVVLASNEVNNPQL